MLRWTGFFLLACAAWAQAPPPASSTSDTGKLDVIVSATMASVTPIAGANVTWVGPDNQSHTGVTGADGHLRVSDLAPGAYRINVRAAGYMPLAVRSPIISPAYVPAGNTTTVYVTMTPTGAIGGTVVDEEGKPVPGAIVVAHAEPNREKTATADAQGRYLIADLEPRRTVPSGWMVKAYVPAERMIELGKGFEPAYSENVAVRPEATADVDLQLRSTPIFHIRGRVADKPDTGGAFVQIKECGAPGEEDSPASRTAVANDGSFDIPALRPGAYCLAFQVAQGLDYKYQSEILVEVIRDRDLDQVELKARP